MDKINIYTVDYIVDVRQDFSGSTDPVRNVPMEITMMVWLVLAHTFLHATILTSFGTEGLVSALSISLSTVTHV